MIPRWLRPASPKAFQTTVILSVVSVAAFVVLNAWSPWRPGRAAGLTFGWLAVVLFVNAAAYPARRPNPRPWRNAQQWLQLHMYGSVLAAVCVLGHLGWRLPRGLFGWALFLLAMWTTLTGIIGAFLQKWVPVQLATRSRVEVLAARVPELIAALVAEADAVLTDAAEPLVARYRDTLRPALAGPPSHDLMQTVSTLKQSATGDDRDRVAALETIVRDRLDIAEHVRLQRLLRVWLVFHVPPGILMLGLLAIHIVAVVLY